MEISSLSRKDGDFESTEEIFLQEDEEKLADELKHICDQNNEETNITKSAEIFHKLGKIYQKRSELQTVVSTAIMMNLIKSAALFNVAIARSPENVTFRTDLKQLCTDSLVMANAKKKDASLVDEAENLQNKIEKMRRVVKEKISTEIDQISLEQEKVAFIRKLQKKITNDYTEIMAQLSHYCELVMGRSPCKFSVIGLGSLAKNEITPYSDFEHIIVLDDKLGQQKETELAFNYFRWFSVIFQIVVLNLQETIIPSVSIASLNGKQSKYGDWFRDAFTTRGICFDGMMPYACKFPLGRQQSTGSKPWKTELIKTVSEMLEYLTIREDLKNGYHLKDILTKICFVYGDETIFENFQSRMHRTLEQDDKLVRVENIKLQILQDLDAFAARSSLLELMLCKEFNLKRVVYRSTTLFISALGQIYNITAQSSFCIIDQLAKKNAISENMKQKLMHAVALACEMRLKWYIKNQCQKDKVKSKSNNETAINILVNLATKEDIVSYFQTAYALQCDVSKRLNLDKKFFYSSPRLFNSSLYFCLGEIETLITITKKYQSVKGEKENRLFSFDDCFLQLQEESNFFDSRQTLENQQDITQEVLSAETDDRVIAKLTLSDHFKEFGNYLKKVNSFDEAHEYFKIEHNILTEIIQNEKCKKTHEPDVILNQLQAFFSASTNKDTIGNNLLYRISSSLLNMGHCLMKLNKLGDAFTYMQQSQNTYNQISQRSKSEKFVLRISNEIGQCLRQMNKPAEAINYFKQALKIAEKTSRNSNFDTDISIVLQDIGRCLVQINEPSSALNYLRKSLEIKKGVSTQCESDRSILIGFTELGRCLMQMNNHDEALDYFKKSLKIAERIGFSNSPESDRNISITLQDIGCCLMQMNKLSEALKYLNRSLKIKKQISLAVGSDRSISTTFSEIGRCLMHMNQHSDALDFFKQSLKIDRQIAAEVNSDRSISISYHDIGCCLMQMNCLEEALGYFRQALEIKERISPNLDADPSFSKTLAEMGRCLEKINQENEHVKI